MDEFEIAVVNEPSMFEPLKFFCSLIHIRSYDCLHSSAKNSFVTFSRSQLHNSDLDIYWP